MMKLFFVIGISLFLFSCKDNSKNSKQKMTKETYQGKIDSHSNIIIKLILKDNLIYGELNYPNKKDSSSFKLIGEIKSDSTYRIQVFSDSGYVFGIISFNYLRKRINGTWFSPSELQEQNIELAKLDNEPNNLYVCPDKKHHGLVHGSLDQVAFELIKRGLIKFNHSTGKYYLE